MNLIPSLVLLNHGSVKSVSHSVMDRLWSKYIEFMQNFKPEKHIVFASKTKIFLNIFSVSFWSFSAICPLGLHWWSMVLIIFEAYNCSGTRSISPVEIFWMRNSTRMVLSLASAENLPGIMSPKSVRLKYLIWEQNEKNKIIIYCFISLWLHSKINLNSIIFG